MRILWVTNSAAERRVDDPASFVDSALVSLRVRVALPSIHLRERGCECRALSRPGDAELTNALDWRPDVAVFSKIFEATVSPDARRVFRQASSLLRDQGIPIVADIADNYFADSRSDDVTTLLRESTIAVANTSGMADEVGSRSDIPVVVIGDPVEGVRREPRFSPPDAPGVFRRLTGSASPARPLRLLWFGGQERNYAYLRTWFPGLVKLSRSMPIELTIVFAEAPEVIDDLAKLNAEGGTALRARFVLWSPHNLQAELAGTDMVLLPSLASDLTRLGASATRLAESVWAGRFVVASGLASYWEFKEAAWIGEDILAGVRWALDKPELARLRIDNGQQIVLNRYAPAVIGNLWYDTLRNVATRTERKPNEK